jgi:putative nucleotidyltransferase with HDIG domain
MLQTNLGRVEFILRALEAWRPPVAAHSRRVAIYAGRLASQLGVSRGALETIRQGALLHDAGKMVVSSRILSKPSRPTTREWQELKIHPEMGMEIAHGAGFDDDVCGIVLYHHERWDGHGYPDGASEAAIPWTARVVSVLDAFDAITSSRDYRERLSIDAARTMIAREAGTRFCPWVVSGLMALPAALLEPPVIDPEDVYLPDGIGHHATVSASEPWRAVPEAN